MEPKTIESRDQNETTTIQRGTNSLCNLKYRESEENLKSERKKRKKGSNISTGSDTVNNTLSSESLVAMGESSKISEMIKVMKEVLKDKEVTEILTAQFREDCKIMIADTKIEIMEEVVEIIDEKMKTVDVQNTAMDERMKVMEKWVDNSDQDARNTHLIV